VVWVLDPGTYFDYFSESFLTVSDGHHSKKIYVSFDFPPQKIYSRFKNFFPEANFILVDGFTFGKGKGDEFFQSFYNDTSLQSRPPRIHCIKDLASPDAFIQAMSALQGEFDEGMLCKYVFDSLTGMQELWGEKVTLNFFTYTCPKLYEQKALAYWPLAREAHSRAFLANISHITQLVISLSFQNDTTCAAKLLKMDGRPSKLLNETHCYMFQDKKIIFFKPFDQSNEASSAETPQWPDMRQDSETDSATIRNKYPIKIGGRIREFRLNRRLSQVALARILNITPSALSQIESNQSLPSLQLFVNIARFFGTSLDSFFVKTPPSVKSARPGVKEKR